MSTHDRSTQDRNDNNGAPPALSRRSFLSKGAAAGVGAAALTGAAATDAKAEIKWDHTADVVIIGAGVTGGTCATGMFLDPTASCTFTVEFRPTDAADTRVTIRGLIQTDLRSVMVPNQVGGRVARGQYVREHGAIARVPAGLCPIRP